MTGPLFLGIDIGTQGARVALIDAAGYLISSGEEDFVLSEQSRQEQSPREWWEACLRSLQQCIAGAGPGRLAVKAIAVTSTSGTVIPLDARHEPLHPAIMYSDKRSEPEGLICRKAALQFNPEGYAGFNSSSGLSKMVWFVHHFPAEAEQISTWIHAADYITGKLCGAWAVTDYTNALKSGFDLQRLEWPAYLYNALPLKKKWLQEVVPSGTPVGTLDPRLAGLLGLEAGITVVAGMTDGCASQIASGAVHPGDWNTTIGTTLVVKGVTSTLLTDPKGRLYNHRHPEGYWMPGGAGNIGADWVTKNFKDEVPELNRQAASMIPTGKLLYPLCQEGERFPFIAPQARGFEPEGLTRAERFTASMEGVAYIERYAYEMIEKLSGEKVRAVYTAGGASNSDVWLMIRSNVLHLPLCKMKHVTGAVGAAILAASKTYFNNIMEATQALTQVEKEISPSGALTEIYNTGYHRFIQVLQEKGYITTEEYA